jgi:hypothetical protein
MKTSNVLALWILFNIVFFTSVLVYAMVKLLLTSLAAFVATLGMIIILVNILILLVVLAGIKEKEEKEKNEKK